MDRTQCRNAPLCLQGGTAGSIPSVFDVPAVGGFVAAGDFLKIAYDNPTAGTITVDGVINYD